MPPLATESRSDWDTAIARSVVYGFLSRALLFPTEDGRRVVVSELVPVLEALDTGSVPLDAAVRDAIEAQDISLDDLRRAHGRLFTHIENQDCPAHESAYCPGDVFRRSDLMADIAGFYKAHGLQVGGVVRERVDHITTELEFMSFLASKQAYAIENLGSDEVEACRSTQDAFLRDHLACWAPGLAARIRLVSDHPYFRAVGSLLGSWVESECHWLGIEPTAERHEPQPQPAPDDGCCGPMGADIAAHDIPVEIRSHP